MGGSIANRVHVSGDGNGGEAPVVTRNDTASRATWLLHEDVLKSGAIDTATLNDRGDAFLESHAEPDFNQFLSLSHIDGTPSILDYDVGDSIKVRQQSIGIDKTMRVIKRTLNFNNGKPVVTVRVIQ